MKNQNEKGKSFQERVVEEQKIVVPEENKVGNASTENETIQSKEIVNSTVKGN